MVVAKVSHYKKYIAEFIGTFALVLIGTGAIVLNDEYNGIVTHLGISIAFGGIVTLMIFAFGKISGAHINPAVTIALWFSGRIHKKEVVPYIIAQLAGAFLASIFLFLAFPGHANLGATIPSVNLREAFIIEAFMTLVLVLVILNTLYKNRSLAFSAIAIGGVVFLEAYFGGPYTGASMNPARSIAPAVISGNTATLWLYILSTILGASLSVITCWGVYKKDCCSLPNSPLIKKDKRRC